MSINLGIHAHKYEDKLHIDAHAGLDNSGVTGALTLEVRSRDGEQWDSVTIFTNNEEMAIELANAINTVTNKYRLKIVA